LNQVAKFINLRLRIGIILLGIIVSFYLYIYGYAQGTENFTTTTYYPAPYGVYQSLILSPNHNYDVADCDSTHPENEGILFYSDGLSGSPAAGLYYCNGDIWNWQSLAGSGLWIQNNNFLYTGEKLPDTWDLLIGLLSFPSTFLHVEGGVEGGAVLFTGSEGTTPVAGAGERFMWIPARKALRSGRVSADQWDDANIGNYSVAIGTDTIARGVASIALGHGNVEATGRASVAIGDNTAVNEHAIASGYASTAIGRRTDATGNYSTALGMGAEAAGQSSTALGHGARATGYTSTAIGASAWAMGAPVMRHANTAIGHGAYAGGGGFGATAATAIGQDVRADSNYSIAMGTPGARAALEKSMVIGLTGGTCETTEVGQFKICPVNSAGVEDVYITGSMNVTGNITKDAPPSFRIPYPDLSKPKGTYLKHTLIESPTAGDNLYRWTVSIRNKLAIIQLPKYYKYLNKDDMVVVSPVGHFGIAFGEVDKKQETLTIHADTDGDYHVILIGTRKDKFATESWKGPEEYIEPNS